MINPHPLMCKKCVHQKRNCDHLKFEDMEVVDVYQGVAKLVKCTAYKKRTERG